MIFPPLRTLHPRVAALVVVAGMVICTLLGCRPSPPAGSGDAKSAPGPVCAADSGDDETPAATLTDAANEATEASAPGDAGVYTDLPPLDDSMQDRVIGFSNDDAYLGYSISTCDPCPAEYHFVSPTKPRIDISYWYHPDQTGPGADKRAKDNDAKVDRTLARIGALHVMDGRSLRGPFPYPDLRFATTTTHDAAHGTWTVLFGARVGTDAPSFPMHVTVGPSPMFGHHPKEMSPQEVEDMTTLSPSLDYVNVTKDGKDIGIVVIGHGQLFYETAEVARMPTAKFVGQIYSDAARQHLARGDAPGAAALNAKSASEPNR